jgi:hypothetical protein
MAEEGFHDYTLATNVERYRVGLALAAAAGEEQQQQYPDAEHLPCMCRLVAQVEQCFRGWMLTGLLEHLQLQHPHWAPCCCSNALDKALHCDLSVACTAHSTTASHADEITVNTFRHSMLLGLLAGLENISHMPPATGPDKQPTNVVRVSNALKHK